jgi:hypothetical protein
MKRWNKNSKDLSRKLKGTKMLNNVVLRNLKFWFDKIYNSSISSVI